MNRIILPVFSLLFLFSCTKSDNPPPPVTNELVKSFTIYYPQDHIRNTTYFSYSQSAQLGSLRKYGYDTFYNIPTQDSLAIQFLLTDTSKPPAALDATYHDFQSPPAVNTSHHLLYYDSLKRLILDSMIPATPNIAVLHILYDETGYTIFQWYHPDAAAPSGFTMNQIDSMGILSNNIHSEINYSFDAGSQFFNYLYSRTYSSKGNPLYNPYVSNSVGSYLVFNQLGDYFSKNLPDQFTGQKPGTPVYTLHYDWITDSVGRVISGTGKDISSNLVIETYGFSY